MTPTEVDRVARAIYLTHWKQQASGNNPPIWENATEDVKVWVRKQALSAIEEVEAIQTEKQLVV